MEAFEDYDGGPDTAGPVSYESFIDESSGEDEFCVLCNDNIHLPKLPVDMVDENDDQRAEIRELSGIIEWQKEEIHCLPPFLGQR